MTRAARRRERKERRVPQAAPLTIDQCLRLLRQAAKAEGYAMDTRLGDIRYPYTSAIEIHLVPSLDRNQRGAA